MTTKARRWSDNQKQLWPFTFSPPSGWRPSGIVLGSGDGDESPGCHLRLQLFGYTLFVELPAIIKPWRQWVDLTGKSWAAGPGYWDIHSNEYGFQYHEGFLQVFLGPQTHDSTTTRSWSKCLPWTQWRFHRMSYYGLSGEVMWTQYERARANGHACYEAQTAAKVLVPKRAFAFDDFDGERITVTTHIEEREWLFGEGWFKWLCLFRSPKVHRSLALEFSKGVGPEKGSWKGGTLGHSIEMLPDELHEAAFRRYCEQDQSAKYGKFRLKFVGAAEA